MDDPRASKGTFSSPLSLQRTTEKNIHAAAGAGAGGGGGRRHDLSVDTTTTTSATGRSSRKKKKTRARHDDDQQGPPRLRLTEEAVRLWTTELVAALEWFRVKGVVHRDLKPQNLVISPTGHLTVVDFGSALLLEEKQSDQTHHPHHTNGTAGAAKRDREKEERKGEGGEGGERRPKEKEEEEARREEEEEGGERELGVSSCARGATQKESKRMVPGGGEEEEDPSLRRRGSGEGEVWAAVRDDRVGVTSSMHPVGGRSFRERRKGGEGDQEEEQHQNGDGEETARGSTGITEEETLGRGQEDRKREMEEDLVPCEQAGRDHTPGKKSFSSSCCLFLQEDSSKVLSPHALSASAKNVCLSSSDTNADRKISSSSFSSSPAIRATARAPPTSAACGDSSPSRPEPGGEGQGGGGILCRVWREASVAVACSEVIRNSKRGTESCRKRKKRKKTETKRR